MDLDTALDKQSEHFTPEESQKINEEIDNLIQETKSTQALDFSVQNAKNGYAFPITIISTLVLMLGASIFGVWLYSVRVEQDFLSVNANIDRTRSNLASVIIDDVREEAAETEQRIESISQQLDKAIIEQQSLESQFDERVSEYRLDLERQIAEEKEALRIKLEQEQLSSDEIKSRLAQQNVTLNEEFNLQLQNFRLEQETTKRTLEKNYTQQVENLRQQQTRQANALSTLRSEIQTRESELEAQVASSNQELLAAQRQIQLIARDREKRERALNEFELLFTNISLTISKKDYQSALEGIAQGRESIASSPFSSSDVASVYLNAFRIQERSLKELIATQSQLDQESVRVGELIATQSQLEGEVIRAEEERTRAEEERTRIAATSVDGARVSQEDQEKLLQQQQELERQQEEFVQQIAVLTNRVDTSQADLLKAQSDLESEKERSIKSNDSLQNLQTLFDSTEQRRITAEQLRDRTLERIDRISKTYAIQEKKQLTDQAVLLSNVQNIIKYLEAKSAGTEDSTLSNAILDLIRQEPVYRQIGTLLAQETNSTVSFP